VAQPMDGTKVELEWSWSHKFLCSGQPRRILDVKNCIDLQRNAEGLAVLLDEMVVGVMGEEDQAHRFAGWVMDNARATVAAMSILEEQRPDWASVGCTEHYASLPMIYWL
jgi:hypothetical protein